MTTDVQANLYVLHSKMNEFLGPLQGCRMVRSGRKAMSSGHAWTWETGQSTSNATTRTWALHSQI